MSGFFQVAFPKKDFILFGFRLPKQLAHRIDGFDFLVIDDLAIFVPFRYGRYSVGRVSYRDRRVHAKKDYGKDGYGYVYILTNPSFREDWVKIGKSSRPVDVRSKELDNTAVPLPFEIYATLRTRKYAEVEKQIHKQIDRLTDLRIRQNREFFNIAPSVALDIMRDVADLLEDAELFVYVDGRPVVSRSKDEDRRKIEAESRERRRKERKAPFKFHMIGLEVGDTVVFDPLGIHVRVASDDKVEYEGRLYSLSAFVAHFLPEEKQTASKAYQGPLFFSCGGKALNDLRKESEAFAGR